MDWLSILPWALFVIAAFWAWLFTRAYNVEKQKTWIGGTHIARKGLLGAPPEDAPLDNDMLMWICWEFLTHRCWSYSTGKYYPPDDVVQRLKEYQDMQRPHLPMLRKAGFRYVDWFVSYATKPDKDGRVGLELHGLSSGETLTSIAEVAEILEMYPYKNPDDFVRWFMEDHG